MIIWCNMNSKSSIFRFLSILMESLDDLQVCLFWGWVEKVYHDSSCCFLKVFPPSFSLSFQSSFPLDKHFCRHFFPVIICWFPMFGTYYSRSWRGKRASSPLKFNSPCLPSWETRFTFTKKFQMQFSTIPKPAGYTWLLIVFLAKFIDVFLQFNL